MPHSHSRSSVTIAGSPQRQPAISVVVPAFRAERWVYAALGSIAEQSLQASSIEVIVVDDASDDDTAPRAQAALDEFGLRGTVIRKADNHGASAARNTGWRAARAEWIQFLDVDDQLAPTKLATQLIVAGDIDDRCAVLYSPWQRLVAKDDAWVPTGPLMDPVIHDPVAGILEDMWFGYVGPCLVRREALISVDGLDETKSLGEDLDLMLRLAMAGWAFQRVPSHGPLYYYRDTPGSLWQRAARDPAALRGKNAIEREAEEHLRCANGGSLPRSLRRALAHRYTHTYQFARDVDAGLATTLICQIASLHLRAAPSSAPRSVRALAPVIGLGNALQVYARLRQQFPARS